MEDEINDPERENDESTSESETKSGISADLIRGHINTIILRTLYERDKYGYEIIEEIETKSHGQYSLKQPTLYSALKRLETQGYINAYWKTDEVSQGGRRKYYTLTDSGREVTERNQAEWEYSRTVIDNLISDRNFDFTQPPPAPVDFKLLKNSTTRIRTVREDEDGGEGRIVNYEEPPAEQVVEIKREDATSVIITEEAAEQPATDPVQPAEQNEQAAYEEQPVEKPVERQIMSDEERKLRHENYLRLISSEKDEEQAKAPYADSIDTEKIIYNNRPETERDYRNLINNLFVNTLREPIASEPVPTPPPAQPEPQATRPNTIRFESIRVDDATAKAREDGLSVSTSEYTVNSRRKRYNRGATMFKCSLIVAVLMLLEFALCIIFKNELGVSFAYPFVILALACAEVLIFGVLCYTDIGKSSRKPTTLIYLSACIIISIIAVLIIFVTSLILNVNFQSVGDIMAKIVIPCIVALNIAIFGLLFYLLSK